MHAKFPKACCLKPVRVTVRIMATPPISGIPSSIRNECRNVNLWIQFSFHTRWCKMKYLVIFFVCLVVESFPQQINPGLAVGIKKSSRNNFLLHPSLTPASYLETRPLKRRSKKSFKELKKNLLEGTTKSLIDFSTPGSYHTAPAQKSSILNV